VEVAGRRSGRIFIWKLGAGRSSHGEDGDPGVGDCDAGGPTDLAEIDTEAGMWRGRGGITRTPVTEPLGRASVALVDFSTGDSLMLDPLYDRGIVMRA